MNNQETLGEECTKIVVHYEECLLNSNINYRTNKGTAMLKGWASDDYGNEWELSARVTVKWKRLSTGFGRCNCGGNMVATAPNRKNPRLQCLNCGAKTFLSIFKYDAGI